MPHSSASDRPSQSVSIFVLLGLRGPGGGSKGCSVVGGSTGPPSGSCPASGCWVSGPPSEPPSVCDGFSVGGSTGLHAVASAVASNAATSNRGETLMKGMGLKEGEDERGGGDAT